MHSNKEKKRKSTYDHVVKYTGLFGGVQGLSLLTSIVRNKLVAELLGPAGMGVINLFNAATTFVSNSTNFGVPFSAVRHVSELYEKNDEECFGYGREYPSFTQYEIYGTSRWMSRGDFGKIRVL